MPEPPLPDELPPISGERSGTVPADDLLERPTPRELEVLALLAQGLSNQEIAERLVLTVGTVKWYLHHLYGKLGVGGRTAALARARALGLLS